jgi:hypothetical protein
MRNRVTLALLVLSLGGLSGCAVVSVAGSVVGTAADVAGTVVSTTADVVTSPLRKGDKKEKND